MTDETLEMIIARVARTYGFRARGPFEGKEQYREALIDHAQRRDYAAAHEVRVGRAQAAWRPEDVQAFEEIMLARTRSEHPARLPDSLVIMEAGRLEPVTDDALIAHAADPLRFLMQRRRADIALDIHPMLTIVLLDGRILVTAVSRGDRISTMKAFARDMPVFGFILTFDAFMHGIDRTKGTTTKRDCLMQHIVTRTCRRVQSRPYVMQNNRAYFDSPPPPDMDPRRPGAAGYTSVEDPYVDVFVSVPTPTGKPS